MITGEPPKPAATAAVINDDPTQLEVLSGLLGKLGLEVRAFENAVSALEAMCRTEPPDLIVTDLYMPELDGWRFCRLLRSPDYAAFNQVPILVVSATFAGEEAARITAELGANAFLPVPVNAHEFSEQVLLLLQGAQPQPFLRVLIVEDEIVQARLLEVAFQAHGYQADSVQTGQEAEEKFKAEDYEVVLLDHHLPDIPGIELLTTLQPLRPDTVFLAMTGDKRPELALDWMKRGASAFVNKPFSTKYLIELCGRARRERDLLRVEGRLEARTQELRASEETHRILLDESPDPIFSFDANGRFLYANRAFAEITGIRRDLLAGQTIREMIRKEVPMALWDTLRQVLETGVERVIEMLLPRTDGDHYFVTSITPILDAEGRVMRAVCSSKNITERKRAEEALSRQADFSQRIFNSTDAHLAVVEGDGRIVEINDAWRLFAQKNHAGDEQLWGPGANYFQECTPGFGDLNFARAAYEGIRQVQQGRLPHFELEYPCPSASEQRWFTLRAMPFLGRPGTVLISHTDVSARKQAEQAMARHRAELKAIYDHSPVMICVVDGHRRVRYANPAFTSSIGATEQELKDGHAFGAFGCIHALPPPLGCGLGARCENCALRLAMEDTLKTGAEHHDIEYTATILRAGTPLEATLLGSTALIPADGQNHLLLCLHDITSRKRAEEELAKAHEHLAATLNALPDLLFEVDADGRIYDFRAPAPELLYLPPRELLGKTMREVLPPEVSEVILQAIAEAQKTGRHRGASYALRVPAGLCWFELSIAAKGRSQGPPERFIMLARDITDRTRAEMAFCDSEIKFRSVVESSPMAMHLYWLDPEDRLILTGANPAADRILQIDHRLLLGKPMAEAFPQLQAADIPGKFRQVARADIGPQSLESPYCGLPASGVCELHIFRTGPNAIAVAFQDISNRKRLEEQVRQAQKMESVGRLAGGVAHDFNNMLQAILGNTALALEDLPPDNPLRELLVEIQQCAERSAALTRQLLAFARKQPVAPKVLNLNATVESMLKILRRLIGEDIQLDWLPGADLWPVRLDPSQIDQLLANLCVNARDAITGIGQITLATHNVTIDEPLAARHPDWIPGNYVRLSVNDNGCGMDKQVLGHLFEPFFTTKAADRGTGLGLATVYGIVKQNHGYINVVTELGHGSTFEIYLPRHAEQTTPQQNEIPKETTTFGHETILLVEDEPAILRVGQRMLLGLGYKVLTADTPGKAIQVAQEFGDAIQLLVTDMVMPEMNGRDLARQLTLRYPQLKCLFMSGYTPEMIAHPDGFLDEGLHFIHKPFATKTLSKKVREALEGEIKSGQ